jgi:ketosteroid isomerase-like protein
MPKRQSRETRRSALLLFAALASGTAFAHPPTQLSSEAEKATAAEIIEFRKALADAINRRDAKALRDMYGDGFTHIHGSGKIDGKEARIVAAIAGVPVIETAPVDELSIRIPGGWTAIATGMSPIRSLADGKTYRFRWTAVYVRTDRSWLLVASQETRLPNP